MRGIKNLSFGFGLKASKKMKSFKTKEKMKNRIVITSFASNVARMETVFKVAEKIGRQVCLVGRSMNRIYQLARQCNYLQDIKVPIDVRDSKKIPKNKIVFLCTGSQGEQRAALARIANGKILKDGLFKNIWIQPASGDAGGALGAAQAFYYQELDNKREFFKTDSMKGSYLGPQFTDEEIEKELKNCGANYKKIRTLLSYSL